MGGEFDWHGPRRAGRRPAVSRSLSRQLPRQYDLIVYALVDSLVLHSGYSSLRLESFLFTQQAFDDIAARLAPGGVFAGYNFYRQGWIVGRIHRLAEQAFGTAPLVMSLPYLGRIGVDDPQASRMTFILASRDDGLSAIRRLFRANESFWINAKPALNAAVSSSSCLSFSRGSSSGRPRRIGAAPS